jgi:capsular polysaccharide biosynthesis protein
MTRNGIVKHLAQAVPTAITTAVELWVGDQRRTVPVSRPIRFDQLSLVSRCQRSAELDPGEPFRPRTLLNHLINSAAPPIKVDGYYLDTRLHGPNNVSHLLMELVPLCLLARRALGTDPTFIFLPVSPRFRELLAVFGIRPVCTYRPVVGHGLVAYLSRELAEYPAAHSIPDCPLYDLIGHVYDGMFDDHPRGGSGRLFISRRGERGLTNEAEVKAYLESIGYVTTYFEQLSITDQISAILSAHDVVCIHGAAMGYLGLKDQLNSVVELLPPNVYHNYFPVAFGHKAKRYVQLIPSFNQDVQFSGWDQILRYKQAAFAVDMEQLKKVVPA